jgi:AsmA protein
MMKKLLVGVALLLVGAGALLYFRAQSIFASDVVRTSVAAQISRVLGQPVEIGSIGATILPRVTMVLSHVRIGNPARITVATLNVGTSARALLSRRIEQATLSVHGARIDLPLPPFAIGAGDEAADDTPVVTIGSIDEIVLSDIEVVSGGRSLRADVRVVPRGQGMNIASMTLRLDDTAVDVTGDITTIQGPTGALTLRASALDMLALQAFATDFAAGAGIVATPETPAPATPRATPMDLRMDITADRATFGTLTLDGLKGSARLTDDQLAISDMGFGVFEGRYSGAVTLGLASTPAFHLKGTLTDASMGALTAWAGSPDAMTGRLAATLDAAGTGTTAAAVIQSTRGAARVDVTQGTVKGLALVRTIVVASSMRADAAAGGGDEAFSRLGASFTLGDGVARTNDLTFESNDVSLDGAGQVGLDGTNIDLSGRVRLSESLTRQAGRDLVRYTQEGGRVTVPVTISGSAGALSVRLETADVLKRAITNKAVEEAGDALRRGIGGLFNR